MGRYETLLFAKDHVKYRGDVELLMWFSSKGTIFRRRKLFVGNGKNYPILPRGIYSYLSMFNVST